MRWPESLRSSTTAEQIAQSQNLTEEGQTYFNQILTEYQLLVPCQNPALGESEVRKVADAIAAKQAEIRTWGDLFGLEIAVVKLQCEDDLRRGAWAIRAKYKDLIGDRTYDAYQTSNPPDPKTGDVNQLRSDTLQILSEFHWAYAFAPLREKIRSGLMKQVFVITTILVVVALLIAGIAYFPWLKSAHQAERPLQIPLLAVVIAMGMIGGYTSLQQRIQSVPCTGDPIVNIAEISNSQFSLYLAPISGAVFAVLLYIIFIGGLLSGPLFPKISTPPSKCVQTAGPNSNPKPETPVSPPTGNTSGAATLGGPAGETAGASSQPKVLPLENKTCSESVEFSEFVTKTGPESGVSFAMLLVWSFIAGFAERFVPDTIDRLVSQASKK